LTDDTTVNQFVIPEGTFIQAGGFLAFDAALGFALNPAGDTIFLINSNHTRVLDAVAFEGQADGVSFGRWPDGANDFYPLQTPEPGTNNSGIVIGNIVINELMYDPISKNDDDQYIELYNQGSNTVSLANWQFTAGVKFTFPPGASIGPNGYVVVGLNTSELCSKYSNLSAANNYGNYSAKLSHDGERVALSMPQSLYGTNTIYVVEDEVIYDAGGRYSGSPCAYEWKFCDDDKFPGGTSHKKFHIPSATPGSDISLQRSQLAFIFLRALASLGFTNATWFVTSMATAAADRTGDLRKRFQWREIH